jgi:dienelactone hydrolase
VTDIDDERPSADERRRMLARLLGGFAPTAFALRERHRLTTAGGFRAERLALAASDGAHVRAFLTGPDGTWQNQPAVLYCHAHGNRYGIGAGELIDGRPALLPENYGPELARRGVVALSIDMPCFGGRSTETESALSKRMLLQGSTLFGRMLCDLAGAFHLLATMEGVDAARIGAFGFSMGATHAFWLGAMEPRIARIAHACAFADLEELAATGAHDLHGPYMTVPGLLPAMRTGEIAGLCAPRPQLALMGTLDPLTPPAALRRAIDDLRASYRHAPDALRIAVDPNAGHTETQAMRDAVLDFLAAD